MSASPFVVACPAPPEGVAGAVRAALEALDWRAALGGATAVLLKPNLGYDLPAPGANTSPEVLEGVCRFFVEEGVGVTIIEAGQVLVDVEAAARQAGVPALCQRYGVTWMNLSTRPYRTHHHAEARVFQQVDLPAVLGEAPLVDVPVMKTHAKTGMSGAIKNLWGLLPTWRHRYHPVLDDALVDLHAMVPIALCVMDATVAMEGNGPKTGTPRRLDTILASLDPVALDRVAAHVIGLSLDDVAHLHALVPPGEPAPEVRGTLPACAPFRQPRHNPVSWLETRLRESPVRPLVFDTPLFDLACAGARTWYQVRQRMIRGDGG